MLEQLKFYMTEASAELLEGRRIYIETALMNRLKKGLDTMNKWPHDFSNLSDPEGAAELIETYRTGLEFFINAGFKRRELE
ncbi:hypothetical protein [Xenorhabdus bovienii]|uniref:hypothetical protein n=1 Tax=Xenorhabdus bovienii TaxID=40576 RepID=UPI0023B32F1E|nr:hypothetical protein [Xenorhabdus bovienii]MDE9429844.1 hypothetical protein [Xenorhabdus bovienii]